MGLLEDHRKNVDNVTTLAIAEVVGAMDLLKDRPVPEMAYQLRLALPEVADTFATIAGEVAVDYYDRSRAEAGLGSVYEAQRVAYDARTPMDNAIGYAIAQTTKGSEWSAVTSILAGSIQRSVAGADRSTISWNIVTDPDGTKYERVPSSGACAFCYTMAAVAEVRSSDYFSKYHNFCRCTSRPVFTGQSGTELPIYKDIRAAYADAESEIKVKREIVNYNGYRRREAAKKFPDLTLTTENLVKIVRETTGLR